jgi:hypothetical protein
MDMDSLCIGMNSCAYVLIFLETFLPALCSYNILVTGELEIPPSHFLWKENLIAKQVKVWFNLHYASVINQTRFEICFPGNYETQYIQILIHRVNIFFISKNPKSFPLLLLKMIFK